MNTLLEVKNLRTYYHTPVRVVPAVDDVNMIVHPGEVIGIVGSLDAARPRLPGPSWV